MALTGRICLVTGASKGVGRGIAVQLGEAGATVYITGRSVDKLKECAAEIQKRGGKAIPVSVDHSDDSQVVKLFERIKSENDGKLDVCVNNAYAGVSFIQQTSGKKFYLADPAEQWDAINGVGLRNHFLCTVYASRMMVERKNGLIVNVSSPGGLRYLFNVAYGVGKAACDRMAADCAHELKEDNVTMVSLWPGPVKTEHIVEHVLSQDSEMRKSPDSGQDHFANAESVEFAGKAIVKLAMDPKRVEKTGKIILVCDLAKEYGFTDEDGDIHDIRSLGNLLKARGHTWISSVVPDFIRLPLSVMHFAGNKF